MGSSPLDWSCPVEGTVTREVTIDPISYVLHICNVYVSMLPSPFIPPSPSSAVSKNLSSMSVSLFLPCKYVPQYHFSRFYLYALIWYSFFSFWLISLCILGSRFIHISRTNSNAFHNIVLEISFAFVFRRFGVSFLKSTQFWVVHKLRLFWGIVLGLYCLKNHSILRSQNVAVEDWSSTSGDAVQCAWLSRGIRIMGF